MGNKSRSDVTVTNKQLTGGLQEYYSGKSVVLAGVVWTSASLISAFQDEDAFVAATAKAKAEWQAQVAALNAKTQANNKVRIALHHAVLVQYGLDAKVLGAFGYSVPQPKTRTAQAKADASAKRKATRDARHIMGKVQRSKLHAAPQTPAAEPVAPSATVTTAK